MAEEGQFFRPVKDFCQRTVVTCKPDDALVDVVRHHAREEHLQRRGL
jgi:hypothetical protein